MDNGKNDPKLLVAKERTRQIKNVGWFTTIGATFITAIITAGNTYLSTCIDHKEFKLTNNQTVLTSELNYINNFIDSALTEDIGVRLRLAEYFKSVSPTDEQRDRWEKYYIIVKKEFDTNNQMKDPLLTE